MTSGAKNILAHLKRFMSPDHKTVGKGVTINYRSTVQFDFMCMN